MLTSRMKKVAAGTLALALTSLSLPAAFAEEAPLPTTALSGNASISLGGVPDGHASGNTFHFYKLGSYAAANADGNKLVSYDVTANPDFAEALKTAFGGDDANAALRTMLGLPSNNLAALGYNGNLRAGVIKLENALRDLPSTTTGSVSDANVNVETERGIYLVLDKAPTGESCMPTLVATPLGAVNTVSATNEETTPEKPAEDLTLGVATCKVATVDKPTKELQDLADDSEDLVSRASFAASDTTNVAVLKQTIPHHAGNTHFWMRLIDREHEGLIINHAQAKVYVGDTLLTDDKYTTVEAADASVAWTVVEKEGVNLPAGEVLKVVVPFHIDSDALATENTFTNSVAMQYDVNGYNNDDPKPYDPKTPDPNGKEVPGDPELPTPPDPNGGGETPPPTGKVQVRVHTLVIEKQDMNGNVIGEADDGASFNLQRGDKYVLTAGGENGVYNQSGYQEDAPKTAVLAPATGYKGTYTVRGLDSGIYTLDETAAPKGFMTLDAALANVQLTIAEDGTVKETGGDANNLVEVKTSGSTTKVIVKNARNILEMPATGAAGIARTLVIAFVLFSAGGVLLLATRRSSKKHKA